MTTAPTPILRPGRRRHVSRSSSLAFSRLYLRVGDGLAAAIVGFAVLFLYTLTLAPTIVAEDAGELVTAAYGLGVAHPPGYPLWTLLSHAFIVLGPSGADVAGVVNFFSAVCGALSCVLAYRLARELGAGRLASVGGGLLLGASHQLWAQSVIAEVYALNLLLFMACLLCLARWDRDRRRRWLLLYAVLFGLGMTNHHTIGVLGPAGLVFVLIRDWRVIRDWRLVFGCLALFVAPLALYLYLPLASSYGPYMDWGHPRTWHALWDHLTRAQYKKNYTPQPRRMTSLFFQFTELGRDYLRQFSPLVGLLGLASLPVVLRRRRGAWIALALLGLGTALALVWVLDTKFERQEVQANQVFFIPVYACAAVLLAGSLDWGIRRARRRLRRWGRPWLTAIALGCLVLAPAGLAVAHNYAADDFSDYWYAVDHARNLMATVEPNGVIFPSGDHNTFPLIYLQRVEGVRPDITIADKYGYVESRQFPDIDPAPRTPGTPEGPELDRNRVIRYLLSQTDRPVYFTVKQPLPPFAGNEGVKQVRTGMLYRAAKTSPAKDPASYWDEYHYRNAEDLRDPPDYGAVNIAADFFFFRGLAELRRQNPQQALAAFAEARRLSHGIRQVMNNIGSALAEHGLIGPAREYYDRALRLDRDYKSALWNQARTDKQVGENQQAATLFKRLGRITPKDFRVPGELGFLYIQRFNLTRRARKFFKASLALNPDQPQIKRVMEVIGDGTKAAPKPVLKADRISDRFGEVVIGQRRETTFKIRNASDRALRLHKPVADCECTRGTLGAKELGPGQSTTLTVRFHETHRLGKQTRRVTVRPTDGPSLTLTLTADVVHPVASAPAAIEIAQALPGQQLNRTLTLRSRTDQPLTIAEVKCDLDGVMAQAPRGDEPAKSQPITLKIATGDQAGDHTGKLTVRFAPNQARPLQIPIDVHVRAPVKLTPRSLFLSDLKRDGPQIHKVTVDLAKGLKARVTEVIPSAPWISVLDPPKRLAGQTMLKIRLDTDAVPDTFNGTLTLQTDQDVAPTIVIPIYGFAP